MFLPFISTPLAGMQSTVGLHGFLLAAIRPADRLPDFQHGGGLHDFFHARRIIHAGQLHKNLVVAQSVLLDDRLADAELVNAVADGLDRLLLRLGLGVFRDCSASC